MGSYDITTEQYKGLAWLLLFLSLISVISSSLIIFFYLNYKRMRKEFLSTLIFLLSLLDVLCWLNIIITTAYYLNHNGNRGIADENHGFCIFLGFFWNLCELLNFGVTLIISIALYLALIKHTDPAKYKISMIVTLFIVSVAFSLIPLGIPAQSVGEEQNIDSFSSYGPVDGKIKCWIMNKFSRILFFYTPLWIICITNSIITIMLFRGLHLKAFSQLHDRYQKRFASFPFIMLVCYFISSIRRVAQLCSNNENITPYWFVVLMYIFMPLQGLLNTIVYGLFEEFIRVRIAAVFTCNWEQLKELNNIEAQNSVEEENEEGPYNLEESKNQEI